MGRRLRAAVLHMGADAHVDEETEGRGVLDDRVLEDVASPVEKVELVE